MKLVTFQPISVIDTANRKRIYYPPKNKVLGKKIYCLKLDESTMENLYLTSPSMPQAMIILDVNDSRVTEIDYVQHVNRINGFVTTSTKSKYHEYTIEYIKKEDIFDGQLISRSDDADVVQDEFMNKHFKELEKLSGHKWNRSADDCMEEFWSSMDAYVYVNIVTQCMLPMRKPCTEEQMDKAHKLVRKYFIRK